jgi:hypothetical protein
MFNDIISIEMDLSESGMNRRSYLKVPKCAMRINWGGRETGKARFCSWTAAIDILVSFNIAIVVLISGSRTI